MKKEFNFSRESLLKMTTSRCFTGYNCEEITGEYTTIERSETSPRIDDESTMYNGITSGYSVIVHKTPDGLDLPYFKLYTLVWIDSTLYNVEKIMTLENGENSEFIKTLISLGWNGETNGFKFNSLLGKAVSVELTRDEIAKKVVVKNIAVL